MSDFNNSDVGFLKSDVGLVWDWCRGIVGNTL